MAIKQVIAGGFPTAHWLAENASNQVGLGGQTWIVEVSQISASPSITGVEAIAQVGVPTATTAAAPADVALTGIVATAQIGSLTVAVSVALTGVAATAALGNVAIAESVTLTGVTASSGVGDLALTAVFEQPLIGFPLVVSSGLINPAVAIDITGLSVTASATAPIFETPLYLTGLSATIEMGTAIVLIVNNGGMIDITLPSMPVTAVTGTLTPTLDVGTIHLTTGLQATVGIGEPIVIDFAIPTMVSLTGLSTSVHMGTLSKLVHVFPTGVEGIVSIGEVYTVKSMAAMRMEAMLVVELPTQARNREVSLSWSDDKGMTYSNPVERSLGEVGETFTSVSWRRLAMGRDRVFSLSWSCDVPTALTGASILYEQGKT